MSKTSVENTHKCPQPEAHGHCREVLSIFKPGLPLQLKARFAGGSGGAVGHGPAGEVHPLRHAGELGVVDAAGLVAGRVVIHV